MTSHRYSCSGLLAERRRAILGAALVLLTMCGCVTQRSGSAAGSSPQTSDEWLVPGHPLIAPKVIAVCKFQNKARTGKHFFNETSLSDALSGTMLNCVAGGAGTSSPRRYFRIIDWNRVSEVFARHNITYDVDVLDDSAIREKVRKVLLNDYFVTGSITSFDDHDEYTASAFSKSKRHVTRVVLQLIVKDALTNEQLHSAKGEGVVSKTVTQRAGFGPLGSADLTQAGNAARIAMRDAVRKLVRQMYP